MGEVIVSRADSSDELYHWGVLGMKWGVRRYQNKDGSLTKAGSRRYGSKDGALTKSGKKHYDSDTAKLKAERKELKAKARTQKKMDKLKDLRDEVDDLKKADAEAQSGESREEKRKRLLNSTDAKEIYENRSLFTTAELNDRINRIDTEARLASKIPEQKTGLDYVNEKMNRASNTVGNVTNMFQKVDTAYSTVAKSEVGKAIGKKLGIESKKKTFDLDKAIGSIDKMSNEEVKNLSERLNNYENIQQKSNRINNRKNSEKVKEQAQKQVNDYNKNWWENDKNSNSSYSVKGDHITDRKTGTGSRNPGSNPSIGSGSSNSDSSKVFTGTVEGKGTSRFERFGNSYMDNNPSWRDVATKTSEYAEAAQIGMSYISGYLPYNEKK